MVSGLDMEKKIFLGKYRVTGTRKSGPQEIERSLAGLAYEAKEIATGLKVALELVPAGSLRPAVRTQLEAEALAARQLAHLNIPRVFDFGFEDDQLVYVTEWCEGTTAEAWVTAHGPMPVAAVLRVALQMVSALRAAAVRNIFHYAINPRNLLIVPGPAAEEGWPLVKVLHFIGVAPALSATDLSTARFNNSATFASPEQLKRGTVDFRSEIFSLGCTLWFLLTGAAPLVISGEAGDAVEVAPTRTGLALERLNDTPQKVRRLLAQMWAANPEERPLDPNALEAELRDCLAEVKPDQPIASAIGIAEVSKTLPLAGRQTRRRIPARTLALAAVLLLVATMAAMMTPGLRPSRLLRAGRPGPIGVPIGIPEAGTKPAIAQGENVATPPASPNETSIVTLPESDLSPKVSEAVIAVTPPPAVASANQIAATPVPSESVDPSVNLPPTPRPVPLIASENPAAVAPAPPAEGPGEVAAITPGTAPATTSAEASSAAPVPAMLPDPPVMTPVEEDSEKAPAIAAKSRAKTRGHVRSTRAAKSRASKRSPLARARAPRDSAMVRLPGGTVRAQVVGTTDEGDWVLRLPSHGVVIVPPPPDF
jgi:serine/threonine-protein kinase